MAVETQPVPSQGKLYQGVAKDAFGYKMMAAMGWSEGKGLGARENGITKHVSVKKRIDLTGIGADLRADDSAKINWCANTHNFEAVLAGLQAEYGEGSAKKRKKKGKAGKSGSSSEASGEAKAADAGGSSSSSEEETAAKRTRLRPQENARGRPQGRYKKREAGKMVKGYSATDLNQILGVVPGMEDPFAAAAAAAVSAQPAAGSDGEAESEEDEEEERKERKKKDKGRKKKEKKAARPAESDEEAEEEAGRAARSASEREATTVSGGRSRSAAAASDGEEEAGGAGEEPKGTPPPPGWWGEKVFVWAGVLGQIRREKKRARGFDEEEQERVYTEAHEHKMQNRKGLGQSSLPKKVAGARWKGKKVTFGEDGEGGGDDEEEEAGDGEERAAGRERPAPSGSERTGGGSAGAAVSGLKSPDKVKWKKLSEAALSKAGGSLKLKALQRAVLAAAGVPEGSPAEGEYAEALLRRLRKSSRFDVGEKKVKLVAGEEGGDDD